MTRIRTLLVALSGAALFACSSEEADPIDVPEPSGFVVSRTITSGGRARTFQLFVPTSVPTGTAAPLLVALHGSPGDATSMRTLSGFERVARAAGFLVAFPEATSDWNEGCGCTDAEARGVDDLRFVRDLVDAVDTEYGVIRERVYAAGFSQGALFAENLACKMAGEIAGIAVVAATMSVPLSVSCSPAVPVPVIFLHGSADAVFPPSGTDGGVFSTLSIRDAVDFWVAANGCGSAPAVSEIDRVNDGTALTVEVHSGCAQGSEVAFYEIENGGHIWANPFIAFPGPGLNSRELDAAEEITVFFARH